LSPGLGRGFFLGPILKRAAVSQPSGQWRDDDHDVLENGVMVGRIFRSPSAPMHRPWMWAIRERKGRTPVHGYEPTREAAMAAFATSWRGRSP
jgi:hypothetical protein